MQSTVVYKRLIDDLSRFFDRFGEAHSNWSRQLRQWSTELDGISTDAELCEHARRVSRNVEGIGLLRDVVISDPAADERLNALRSALFEEAVRIVTLCSPAEVAGRTPAA